jgi:hypothetical protein
VEGDWVVTEGVDSKLVYIKSSFDFNQNLLYIFFWGEGVCLLITDRFTDKTEAGLIVIQ